MDFKGEIEKVIVAGQHLYRFKVPLDMLVPNGGNLEEALEAWLDSKGLTPLVGRSIIRDDMCVHGLANGVLQE